MSDPPTTQPEPEANDGAPPGRTPLRGLRDRWPIPVLALSLVLLGAGIAAWSATTPDPDFDGAMDSVQANLDARRYEQALETLNGPLAANIEHPTITREQLGRFWALRADTLHLYARSEGIDRFENHRAIVDNYEVARARYDFPLTPDQQVRLADALLAMEREEEALKEADLLPPDRASDRARIVRTVIERGLAAGASDFERQRAFELLTSLRADPSVSEDERLWAVAQQARLSLDAARPQAAIDRLLPAIQRLDRVLSPEAAGLLTILGEAYLELGRLDEATKHLTLAEELVPASDRLSGRIGVLLARVDASRGNTVEARDRFAQVASRFPSTPVATAAWLGVAETSSDDDETIRAYSEVVLGLDGASKVGDVTAEQAHDSLGQRHAHAMARADDPDQLKHALRLAILAGRLFTDDDIPAEAVIRLAETHRVVANDLLSTQPRTPSGAVDLVGGDPITIEEARQHFAKAGKHFARHARMTLLADTDVYRDSLWMAADSYDRAGDVEQAIALFADFAEAADGDPRQLEAQYRLGKAWLARGDFDSAIEFFTLLQDNHATSMWAYRSYVPLAQAYLLRSGWADTARARPLLERIVDGQVLDPDAPEFRQALIALGDMHRRTGAYTRAIARFEEAASRYPDLLDEPQFVFDLAEALRRSAGDIREQLDEAMPATERLRLRDLRLDRLQRASDLFETARTQLMDRDPRARSRQDEVIVRNALLFRADCTYDLAQLIREDEPERAEELFKQAIRRYDTAAQRYADEPASLSAMIQVVNCYIALGDHEAARIAHQRARSRLDQLPDEAFETDASPMDRTHWERWLDAAIELDRIADAQ